MDNERHTRRGWAKWVGFVFCAMIATHAIVEVVTVGQTRINLRNGWELGSNGYAVHAMCARGDSLSEVPDYASSELRWIDSEDLFFCQAPLWAPFLVAALGTAILFRRDRAREANSQATNVCV